MKKKIIAAAAVLALSAGAFYIVRNRNDPGPEPVMLSNSYSREAYLNIKGLDVTLKCSDKIKIPEKFTGIYEKYAEIQKRQQLPLENFKGREAERFLYKINSPRDLYAELVTVDGELVSGTILDYEKQELSAL